MKVKVITKQLPSKKWACTTNIENIDVSFVGDDMEVVIRMKYYLDTIWTYKARRENEKLEIEWSAPYEAFSSVL